MRPSRYPLGLAGVVLGVFFSLATPAGAQVSNNPLVGQWHLDEQYEVDENDVESPDGTPDSSGGNRPLVGCNGCIFLQPGGRFGNHQPASANKPLNTGTGIRPQQVTLIAWVRRNSFPGGETVIAGQVSGALTCDGMSYALAHHGGESDGGVDFAIRQPGGTFVATPADTDVDDGDWHMLAGTFDGSRVRLFVDGVQFGSTPTPAAAIEYTSPSGLFGIDSYAGACDITDYAGDLDEVRVYNRALSATEIGRLASPSATSPPPLVPDAPPNPPVTPPGPPSAAFVLPDDTPDPFAPITLDASGSGGRVPFVRYDWDLTGDGRKDVSCDPETPLLTTNTLRPSVRSIGLTVVDARGATSTVRQSVQVESLALTPALRSTLKATGVNPSMLSGTKAVGGLCSPRSAAAVSSIDTTAHGGPLPDCISQVVYGSFKAVGCWRLVTDPSTLPRGERAAIDPEYRNILFSEKTEKALNAVIPAGRLLGPLEDLPNQGVPIGPRRTSPRATASASWVQYAQMMIAATANSTFLADGPVRVNGLDVRPAFPSKVVFAGGGVLAGAKARLVSSSMEVVGNSPFGKLPMKKGQLLEAFGLGDTNSPLGQLNIPNKLTLVPGLGIRGTVSARMENYKLKIGANISLPSLLKGITSDAKLEASTEKGLELDFFRFDAKEAPLGPVILKNLFFEWQGGPRLLTAGLDATILYKVSAGGRITFQNGGFVGLKVSAGFFPGVVLAPAVHLVSVNAEYDQRGPVIGGGGTITVGPNPPPGDCPKVGVTGSVKLDFNHPITLSGQGASKFFCFSMASLGASLNEYGYGTFFGRFNPDLHPLPFSVDANAKGQIQAPIDGRIFNFQLDMELTACVDFGEYGLPIKACIPKSEFTASNRAMAVCVDWGVARTGARVFYPPIESILNTPAFIAFLLKNTEVFATGCDVGLFRTMPKLASASQAGSQAFTMPAGRRDAVVSFRGRGGAPDMVLRGPGGRTIVVPSLGMVRKRNEVAFRMDYNDTAVVMIRRPAPGRWTVDLKPGSPALTSIGMGLELPPIKLKASVRKSRSKRVLRWRINKRKGQSIRFTELAGAKGGKFLGETKRASGRIRFTPAESRTRRHTIQAMVIQDGAPRDSFTVARFRAALPRIGRPRRLKARRRKSRLVITWRAAKNAQAYRAYVTLSDGRKLFFTPRRRRIVVRRVAKRTRATVVVQGTRASRLGRRSQLRVKAVKAKKKAKKRSKSKRR